MRPRDVPLLLLLSSSAVRAVAQVDPGFEPVPAANLSDRTLSVPEENFSMRAPGVQWEWLRSKAADEAAGRSYLCRNLRTGERFLLMVSEQSSETGGGYARGWLDRIKASQEAQGRELVGTRSDPSDVPASGSLRLSTMITAPGTTIYFTGYVLAAGRIYALQHYSDAPKESPVFHAFARSFALLDPAAVHTGSRFLSLRNVLVVGAVLAVLLFGFWIYDRAAKRGRARRR